ncbi:transmembrane ascorbate ferrireductase 2-like [Zingiber officinale]|uniref:transmembrane ascorbate ferrireductase 2-like n=1 Tax=Zingiber officinale TaxID=94328 RepID=UPI001C4C6226|nr:transmembrane ascorbate ferrireductase 2-like [Zingiber officinale]
MVAKDDLFVLIISVNPFPALKFHNDKEIDSFYSLHPTLGLPFLVHPGCFRNWDFFLLSWHIISGLLGKAICLQSSDIISSYSNYA